MFRVSFYTVKGLEYNLPNNNTKLSTNEKSVVLKSDIIDTFLIWPLV